MASEPVTLEEAKLHLRINPGDNSEDGLVGDIITAAREYCENYTGRVFVGDEAEEVPKMVKQAMLLLIAHWYNNREAVTVSNMIPREMEMAVRVMLNQFKVWWF